MGFAQTPCKKRKRRKLVADDSEAHVLVVAPTGAGKGRNLMIPTLLTNHAPAVVIDVKGEAAMVTARARREMGHEVHIIDPFHIVTDTPDTFNPLDVIDPHSLTFLDDVLEFTEAIIGPEASLRDRFWDNWSRSVISALTQVVIEHPDQRASLGNIWHWLNKGDTVYDLAVLLDSKKVNQPAYAHIAGLLALSEKETRPSVVGTAQQHVRLFGNPAVSGALETTSFDLETFRQGGPQTIYLVMPPDKLASHAGLLRMWLWGLMSTIVKRDHNPEHSTLFIIDEMAHLGPMPIIEHAVTLMRGYGVRLMVLLQSMGQLEKLYPNDHGIFASNCLISASFGMTHQIMAKPLADLLGDMSADQLITLPADALAYRLRSGPTKVLSKLDYLRDSRFAGLYDINDRYGTRPAPDKKTRKRKGGGEPRTVVSRTASAVPANDTRRPRRKAG